jgi:hypothetical protein
MTTFIDISHKVQSLKGQERTYRQHGDLIDGTLIWYIHSFACKWKVDYMNAIGKKKCASYIKRLDFLLLIILRYNCYWNTIFTWMQDDPDKKYVYQRKIYLSNPKTTPKNKMPTKKKYFTISCIHLVHKACQILSTVSSYCHCLHLHSQCLHLPHTHS